MRLWRGSAIANVVQQETCNIQETRNREKVKAINDIQRYSTTKITDKLVHKCS